MRKTWLTTFLIVLFFAQLFLYMRWKKNSLAPTLIPNSTPSNFTDSFDPIVRLAEKAVVNINTEKTATIPQQDQNQFGVPPESARPPRGADKHSFRLEGTGSGVLIDPEGYILTNAHVVQGAQTIRVMLQNGQQFDGKLMGLDERTDLAVLLIDHSYPAPYMVLGDSSKIRIGDWVLAFGSPFGLQKTVTTGIISARRQTLNIQGHTFQDLIQTDAAINRGNSGGPLVNIWGEVIGINTAIFAPTGVFSGIGFAVPINQAKKVLADLIHKGHVDRSWIGVSVGKVDEVFAEQYGLPSAQGALVNSVYVGSPAEKAGIMRGDVITEFSGTAVKSPQELQDLISAAPSMKEFPVIVYREGQKKTLSIKTAPLPKDSSTLTAKEGPVFFEWLGAEFSDLTEEEARRHGIDGQWTGKGLLVVSVSPQGEAREIGLKKKDVVLSINQIKTPNVVELKRMLNKFDIKKGIVLDIVRDGSPLYLSYKNAPSQ